MKVVIQLEKGDDYHQATTILNEIENKMWPDYDEITGYEVKE